jgi:hypothetical protein
MLVIAVCVALVLLGVQIVMHHGGAPKDPATSSPVYLLLLDPAWPAVLGFSVLALFQGMLVAAVADILTA